MNDTRAAPVVFDPAALEDLTGDARDAELAVLLADHYRRLLPERIARIASELHGPDPFDAMDPVLSLKVSSNALGARELGALAAAVERRLRMRDVPAAHAAFVALAPAVERVERELAAYLTR